MANPERIAAKVQRVKDLACELNLAMIEVSVMDPSIKIEARLTTYQRLDMAFPVETIQVKLMEVKTL